MTNVRKDIWNHQKRNANKVLFITKSRRSANLGGGHSARRCGIPRAMYVTHWIVESPRVVFLSVGFRNDMLLTHHLYGMIITSVDRHSARSGAQMRNPAGYVCDTLDCLISSDRFPVRWDSVTAHC